jgi:Fe-S-cluster containining protein
MAQMPRLAPGEAFCFDCHPGVSCLNACCADTNIPLTPYDVVRLRERLEVGSDAFLERYAMVEANEDVGIDMVHLHMAQGEAGLCPFASDRGCQVYPDRPSACRTFPLGRALRRAPDGRSATEEYVLLDPPFCQGFSHTAPSFTATDYVTNQGLDIYHRFNDRYFALLVRWQAGGQARRTDAREQIFTALYRLDAFRALIDEQQLLAKSGAPERLHDKILTDEPQRLWFAYKLLARLF